MRRGQALALAFQANFVHHSRGWPQSRREIRPQVVCRLVGIQALPGTAKDTAPTGCPHGDMGRRCSRTRTQAWGHRTRGRHGPWTAPSTACTHKHPAAWPETQPPAVGPTQHPGSCHWVLLSAPQEADTAPMSAVAEPRTDPSGSVQSFAELSGQDGGDPHPFPSSC